MDDCAEIIKLHFCFLNGSKLCCQDGQDMEIPYREGQHRKSGISRHRNWVTFSRTIAQMDRKRIGKNYQIHRLLGSVHLPGFEANNQTIPFCPPLSDSGLLGIPTLTDIHSLLCRGNHVTFHGISVLIVFGNSINPFRDSRWIIEFPAI